MVLVYIVVEYLVIGGRKFMIMGIFLLVFLFFCVKVAEKLFYILILNSLHVNVESWRHFGGFLLHFIYHFYFFIFIIKIFNDDGLGDFSLSKYAVYMMVFKIFCFIT